jgi:hypothetical protein
MLNHKLLISCIAATCLVTYNSLSYAQEHVIRPYIGVSGNIDTNGDPGWGIEAGVRLLPFYAGLEYGTYSYRPTVVNVYLRPVGYIPPPYPVSTEQFWGVHVGYVINYTFFVGIVLLQSYEMWVIPKSDSSSITTPKSYLNIGPDFRYAGIDDGHIYLAFAFTVRRGLKAGLGYIL